MNAQFPDDHEWPTEEEWWAEQDANKEWIESYNREEGNMAIVAKSEGGDFKHAEPGTDIGRCYMILDLGHQKNEYQGEVSIKHQVLVAWEIPSQLMDDGRPISISKFYTLSLHDKSNLGQDLASWRGKAFTEEEKKGFDISRLIGVPAMLSIIVDKNGKSRVGSVMGVPKGMTVPEAINTPVIFDMEAYLNGDRSVFESLSDGLKGILNKAQEITSPADHRDLPAENFDGDIPF